MPAPKLGTPYVPQTPVRGRGQWRAVENPKPSRAIPGPPFPPPRRSTLDTPSIPHARQAGEGSSAEIPASLNDRAADIWEPLLALADLAGGARAQPESPIHPPSTINYP